MLLVFLSCRPLLKLFAFQVLHLLAMARAADIELNIDDFQMMADKTPFLADLMYTFHSPSIWIHLTKW